MRRVIRKAWIGVGVATALASTTAHRVEAQHSGHGNATKEKAAATQDSGLLAAPQSGESYLTDGGPKDTRVRIYRDLALMHGHLLVGAELIAMNMWEEALPHFLHPTEELYGSMERYIKLHKITPFDRQLKQLAQAVKARNTAAYEQALKVVNERLVSAFAGFRRYMQGAPLASFTAQAVAEVMKVAVGEYQAAIENGRFGKPVEYQDGRGFALYAQKLLLSQRAEFEAIDRLAFQEMLRLLESIKRAWPTAVPPAGVAVSPAALGNDVDTFVKQSSRYF